MGSQSTNGRTPTAIGLLIFSADWSSATTAATIYIGMSAKSGRYKLLLLPHLYPKGTDWPRDAAEITRETNRRKKGICDYKLRVAARTSPSEGQTLPERRVLVTVQFGGGSGSCGFLPLLDLLSLNL